MPPDPYINGMDTEIATMPNTIMDINMYTYICDDERFPSERNGKYPAALFARAAGFMPGVYTLTAHNVYISYRG